MGRIDIDAAGKAFKQVEESEKEVAELKLLLEDAEFILEAKRELADRLEIELVEAKARVKSAREILGTALGVVVQSVEYRPVTPVVAGSSPVHSAININQ